MGAWGVEPFENDSALDWLHGVQKAVEKALYTHRRKGKYGSTGQHEALAAAVLIRQVPTLATSATAKSKYEISFAEEALVTLKLLEKDEQFIESWNSPKRYLVVLAREMRAIARIARVAKKEREARFAKMERRLLRRKK